MKHAVMVIALVLVPCLLAAAIDKTAIDACKSKLGVTDAIKIVLVPNDAKIKVKTQFKDFPSPERYIFNLSGPDLNDSVATINFASGTVLDEDTLNSKAYDILDVLGGGGYDQIHDMIVLYINPSDRTPDRTLLHEMGHWKQNRDGYNNANTTSLILDYHNILAHENLYGPPIRKCYTEGKTKAPTKKTWDDFVKSAAKPKDAEVIGLILRILDGDSKYSAIKDEIKTNLIKETFAK